MRLLALAKGCCKTARQNATAAAQSLNANEQFFARSRRARVCAETYSCTSHKQKRSSTLRLRKRAVLQLALATSVALAASCGHAFEVLRTSSGKPTTWSAGAIPVLYRLNDAGSADVTLDQARLALAAAFGAWQAIPTSAIAFSFGGTTSRAAVIDDGVNLVRWYETGFPFDENSLAVTVTTFNDINGNLIDADISVNGNFAWATDGRAGRFDIQNVLTHEAGHCLGLGHSSVRAATMFADAFSGEVAKRSLHSDDIAGVTFLYPVSAPPPAAPADPGDVNSSGRVDGRDLTLLALAFGASRNGPRFRATADFNGDGVVDGDDLAVVGRNFGVLY